MNTLPFSLTTTEYHRLYADAIEAKLAGKPVEFWDAPCGQWRDEIYAHTHWSATAHRPKPEPKTRPWSKPDDVPGPVCWLKCGNSEYLITEINPEKLIGPTATFTWGFFHTGRGVKYSTDRKTWLPCTVT